MLKDPLLQQLQLKDTESIQDAYLRVREDLCKHDTAFAKSTKELQHDEILQMFQGLARIYCPHLEDVRDPLGSANYLDFSKIRIPSLESAIEADHTKGDGGKITESNPNNPSSDGQRELNFSSIIEDMEVNLPQLLVELLMIGLVLYAVSRLGSDITVMAFYRDKEDSLGANQHAFLSQSQQIR
ncbi:MAG: hypothetical protein Q9204_007018 [Flavoplaca sp. TL-2023a]